MQTYNPEGTEPDTDKEMAKGQALGKRNQEPQKRESGTAGKKTGTESERVIERHKNRDRQRGRDGEQAARHAGRLSVSGLWECGRDTVVGSVPALKLESGAKRREPEPKAVWELPGAASPAHCREKIYCWAALQTVHRSWCAI